MEIQPTSYPKAYEMTKDIIKTLQSNYLGKEKLKAKYWLLDFINSKDGITYFLQVKSFKCEQPNAKSISKDSGKLSPRRLALRQSKADSCIKSLKNEGIYDTIDS